MGTKLKQIDIETKLKSRQWHVSHQGFEMWQFFLN